jgi:hypothetical protein
VATKRRGLRSRVTDDLVVNFGKASWFIELENWFWKNNQRHYKNVSYQEWAREVVKPFRPFLSIRFQQTKRLGLEQAVSGSYTAEQDTKFGKPIQITVHYYKWPDYSDSMRRRAFMLDFIKVVAHELNHQRQNRVRKYFNPDYIEPYYHDPDEIQSWALNATQAIVARYGIKEAKKVFSDFRKIGDKRYCSEHRIYAIMPEKVKKRFLRHVARYLDTYEDYYQGKPDIGIPKQLLKRRGV